MQISKQSNIYRLNHQHFLPLSIEQAWRFISTPQNLQKITPKELDFKITSPVTDEIYSGQIITYSIRLNKAIKMNWVTEITHLDEGTSFVDEQRFGPYKMWHHLHTLEKVKGGVLMTDTVHFKLPMFWLAPLIYRLYVKRNLTAIFEYRTTKLDALLSSADTQQKFNPMN